jgi:tetrahydromethanopterin S-methyltransferase subunit B
VTLGSGDLAASALGFVLGLVFIGLPALVPTTIAAVLWAAALRRLERPASR